MVCKVKIIIASNEDLEDHNLKFETFHHPLLLWKILVSVLRPPCKVGGLYLGPFILIKNTSCKNTGLKSGRDAHIPKVTRGLALWARQFSIFLQILTWGNDSVALYTFHGFVGNSLSFSSSFSLLSFSLFLLMTHKSVSLTKMRWWSHSTSNSWFRYFWQ